MNLGDDTNRTWSWDDATPLDVCCRREDGSVDRSLATAAVFSTPTVFSLTVMIAMLAIVGASLYFYNKYKKDEDIIESDK